MRIGIYNGTASGLGGAGQSVAVLAEALAKAHQVDIFHHGVSLTREQLSEYSGTDLNNISLHYIDKADMPQFDFSNSRRLLKSIFNNLTERDIFSSSTYDFFITFTHNLPPFCNARKGILRILFPSPIPSPLRKIWRRHLDSYQLKVANSHYTHIWTRRHWNVESHIIYPPCDTSFAAITKENIILSVGRFVSVGLSKKQLEMMIAFERVRERSLRDWSYFSVGGLGQLTSDNEYYKNVFSIGNRYGANVMINIERAKLRQLYERAKIFWHAAGYGENDHVYPELVEHFGTVTVEAMAAGCVPVVINKGGQREIVQHGVTGFLWNTLDELEEYTRLISRNDELRIQMSEAARAHAIRFDKNEYINRFYALMQQNKKRT